MFTKVTNTHDLSRFMDEFKSWASENREDAIVQEIERAERQGHTASELIYQYQKALSSIRRIIPPYLPPQFREQLEPSIRVAEEALEV